MREAKKMKQTKQQRINELAWEIVNHYFPPEVCQMEDLENSLKEVLESCSIRNFKSSDEPARAEMNNH